MSDEKRIDSTLCPKCLEPLKVESRGKDYFAYCPGPNGHDGCMGMGEFADTREAAVAALYDISEIHDL